MLASGSKPEASPDFTAALVCGVAAGAVAAVEANAGEGFAA
jgi:hypothetical protein